MLANNCYECHSTKAEKPKGGLYLDSRAGLLKGGDLGPVINLSDPSTSRVLEAIGWQNPDLQMPPETRLPERARADLQKWIAMGAPWPGARSEVAARPSSGEHDFVAERETHWAWKPVIKPDVPELPAGAAVRNELDHFVLAELAEHGLSPSPEAPRHTLIRRLYLDLLGLPPTVEQTREFVEGEASWEEIVERLLDSPQYGERWGRHWLDVARYSAGYGGFLDKAKFDQEWRYRDWVIEAFNKDLPYDEFLRLQIAGDLVDTKHAVATGMFALGPAYISDGGDPNSKAMAESETLDDRVDTLGRGVLGLTVACARCHDHKFDPIPTLDYYSIAGIFRNTGVHESPLASSSEIEAWNQAINAVKEYETHTNELIQRRAQELADEELKRLADYMMAAVECMTLDPRPDQGKLVALGRERGLAGTLLRFCGEFLGGGKADAEIPALDEWFAGPSRESAEAFQAFVLANPDDEQVKKFRGKYFKFDRNQAVEDIGPEFVAEIKARKEKHEEMRKNQPPKYATAHTLRDSGSGNMPVALRGNLLNKGPEAPRRFLRLLAPDGSAYEQGSGRLELAAAVTDPANPLTARVFVNRLWGWHFGEGLVRTPSNFGTLGRQPTHPELLDWLAAVFVERGWSVKAMHRLIVTSATWRQSSSYDAEKFAVDGENALLWRMNPRKLEVEAWRDSILAVTGELDIKRGGPSFVDPAADFRRTVYARTSRNGDQFAADRFLQTFDFPPPRASVAKRTVTVTPQQALFLLNNPFVIERAKALAKRLEGQNDVEARMTLAYQLLFARRPSEAERSAGREFLTADPAGEDSLSLTRLERYAQALLVSNEFMFVE